MTDLSEPVRQAARSEPGTTPDLRPVVEDRAPVEALPRPSTSASRRVPVGMIAAVTWVRLMERP